MNSSGVHQMPTFHIPYLPDFGRVPDRMLKHDAFTVRRVL
jgi:hypothetical protein